MANQGVVLALLLTALLVDIVDGNIRCLHCEAVLRPRDCPYVETCGPNSYCSVEAYKTPGGTAVFRIGCKDKLLCHHRRSVGSREVHQPQESGDNRLGRNNESSAERDLDLDPRNVQSIVCSECCHSDLCNVQGCGQTGYVSGLGPLCFACDQQRSPDSCTQLQQCGRDELCELSYVDGLIDEIYSTRCVHKAMCSAPLVGRKRNTGPPCAGCCTSNLCNSCPGNTPTATSRATISVGPTAAAFTSQPSSTTVGHSSTTIGHSSTTIGHSSSTIGQSSTTIGQASSTNGHSSTTIGQRSTTIGQSSTTIGQSSTTIGQSSTTIGQSSTTIGQSSTTIGQSSTTVGQSPSPPLNIIASPNKWVHYAKSTYYFSLDEQSWYSAMAFCVKKHGHLLKIDDQSEFDNLRAYLMLLPQQGGDITGQYTFYWTAGNDVRREDSFEVEFSGVAVPYLHWAHSKPTNSSRRNCVGLWKIQGFAMEVDGCDIKHRFICERS